VSEHDYAARNRAAKHTAAREILQRVARDLRAIAVNGDHCQALINAAAQVELTFDYLYLPARKPPTASSTL